jgi:hypothetical protein
MKKCLAKVGNKENYKTITEKQNKFYLEKFIKVPSQNRIIFVPHCMRKTKVCKAKENEGYYICTKCHACKIGKIQEEAERLNYAGLFILKGGRAIVKIIEQEKPKAVVGVACLFEGKEAFALLKKYDIAVQFVALSKDGCSDTDVDLEEVYKILQRF